MSVHSRENSLRLHASCGDAAQEKCPLRYCVSLTVAAASPINLSLRSHACKISDRDAISFLDELLLRRRWCPQFDQLCHVQSPRNLTTRLSAVHEHTHTHMLYIFTKRITELRDFFIVNVFLSSI